jgi:hypothetical protein
MLRKDPSLNRVLDPSTQKPITPPPKGMDAYAKRLLLPSSLGTIVPCSDRLRSIEFQLRWGQADEALADIRNAYQTESKIMYNRKTYGHGVREGNRSAERMKEVQKIVRANAAKYRVARTAMAALAPILEKLPEGMEQWESKYQVLKDDDLCPLPVDDFRVGQGKKPAKQTTWIWFQYNQNKAAQNQEELDDGNL